MRPEALSAKLLIEMNLVNVKNFTVFVRRVVVGKHEGGEAENVVAATGLRVWRMLD
jgi:hypothetical protein